jgi:hypothetical protein
MANKIADTQININMMSAILRENSNGNPQMRLTPQEVEKTKLMLQRDVQQYNNDLKLLSLLIGRPLNEKDIAKLANTNLGKPKEGQPLNLMPTITQQTTRQRTSSTSPVPAFKPLTDNEEKFLQALQQIQTTRSTTPSTTVYTTTELPKTTQILQSRVKSQEAIIAQLLKQQGIGPANVNQVDVEVNNL